MSEDKIKKSNGDLTEKPENSSMQDKNEKTGKYMENEEPYLGEKGGLSQASDTDVENDEDVEYIPDVNAEDDKTLADIDEEV